MMCRYVPQHDGNTLSGGSQTQGAACRVIPLIELPSIGTSVETREMSGCQGLRRVQEGCEGDVFMKDVCRGSFWGGENVQKLDSSNGCTAS